MPALAEKPTSVQALLHEAQKLSSPELEEFGRLVFELQIERDRWRPETEQELVERIHNWAPQDLRDRYFGLHKKRRDDTISDVEYQELLGLIDQVGMFKADRVRRLIDLAKIRNITLDELVAQPEFAPREL